MRMCKKGMVLTTLVAEVLLWTGSSGGQDFNSTMMHYGEGVHAYFAGNSQQAEAALSQAMVLNSQDPRIYYFRALSLLRQGRTAEARGDMLVGALGINVALLCVSADEGVMPQTREHVQILNLLPVDRMVVAITRCDLVDAETLELAMADVRQFLGETRFGGAPVLPVSALKGDGLDALRSALDQALMDGDAPLPGAPCYLAIDRAFSVKGHGVVVTGTLAQGRVGVGQQAVLQPGHQEVRVRGIHIHGEVHDGSERGRRTAVNLGGVKLEEVRRGMALGAAEALFETTCMDAELVWTSPPKHGLRVRVAIGAAEAIGRLFLTDGSPSLGQLRLEEPVAAALGQPIIVRRYSPPDLIGGGRVTVPQAKPRRRSEASSTVQASGDEAAILEVLEGAPAGVATEEIARRLGKSVQALGTVFEGLSRSGAIKGFAGLWMTQEAFDVSSQRLLDSLRHLHELNPAQATIPREKAVHEAGLPWAGKPLDRILSAMAAEGRVVVAGTLIRDPEFKVRLSARQREFLDRVKDVMNRRGVNAPSAAEIAQEVAAPPREPRSIPAPAGRAPDASSG